jgi:hypothetical protein
MAASGLEAGQLVDLTSHFKETNRIAKYFFVTPFEIPRGCAATYFPEANVDGVRATKFNLAVYAQ